jgi:hypothetical protein
LLSAPYPFLCDHLSSHWWLLQTSLFLLPSSFQREKKHIAYLAWTVISPLFYQGTMLLGKREIVQPIPITLWHVQSRGIALHTPED